MDYAVCAMIHRPSAAPASLLGGLALIAAACGADPHSAEAGSRPVVTVELPAPADSIASASPSESPAPSAPSAAAAGANKPAQLDEAPFVARFAVVFRSASSAAQPGLFGGDSIVLFEAPVTCDEAAIDQAAPKHFRVSAAWKAGEKLSFQSFVFKNGKGTKHSGSVEVRKAPSKKGDIGRIFLDPIEGATVTGGEIDALVCE